MKDRGWKYFLIAVIDVEANYLVVKAYRYTTVTSVQLLDCFAIPTVLVLSWLFLRVRYQILHVIGVGVCLLGVGALVAGDIMVDKVEGEGSNHVLGDMLCLAGAALYGTSNVAQEFAVRNHSGVEYLGMVGFFGSIINGIQFAVLERSEVMTIDWGSYKVLLPLIGFALCLFAMYSLMPVVIHMTSAAVVNLSILSADFYALLFGLFLFHYKFHFLYFISFALVIIGVSVYSIKPPPVDTRCSSDYREMHTGDAVVVGVDNATPSQPESPNATTEITYHTHPTPNGTSAESCTVHVSKYIPPSDSSEEQRRVMLHLEEGRTTSRDNNVH